MGVSGEGSACAGEMLCVGERVGFTLVFGVAHTPAPPLHTRGAAPPLSLPAMSLWSLCQVRPRSLPLGVAGARAPSLPCAPAHKNQCARRGGRGARAQPAPTSFPSRPLSRSRPPSSTQAVLMVINGLAIVNNDRFLEKCELLLWWRGERSACVRRLVPNNDPPAAPRCGKERPSEERKSHAHVLHSPSPTPSMSPPPHRRLGLLPAGPGRGRPPPLRRLWRRRRAVRGRAGPPGHRISARGHLPARAADPTQCGRHPREAGVWVK